MPLFNPDILLHQAAGKAVIDTDKARGGLRSAIDDWTDLFATYTDPGGNTKSVFQDEHTNASPGWLKQYSTMFYVADGRALVQNNSASTNFILINPSTGVYDSGGTKFEVSAGTAEPEYWVLTDITQVGGSGSGTDKLPKFTISGESGSYTAVPAGFEKLNIVNSAASSIDGFTSLIVEDEDGATLTINNGDTLKIAGGNAVSTAFAGGDLVITVPTASVVDSGTSYATGDQIYDFVTNFGYTTNAGTVTQVTSSSTNQLTVTDTTTTPALAVVTSAVSSGATALATGAQISTYVTGYADPIGTDNSTNVTLANTNYLTLSNQEITGGTIPVTSGGTNLTSIAAGSLLQAATANALTALTGAEGTDGYLVAYNHSATGYELVEASANANNSTITLTAGTGLTTGGSFTTNTASAEEITFNVDGKLADIAGLSGSGLLTTDGTNVTLDASTYLVSGDISSLISHIDVTEGTDASSYKVLMTSADAAGDITETYIDSNDLTFTPASADDRGKLTTGDLLVKGDFTVLGEGSVVNIQQENVYVRDAIITLGNADAGNNAVYTDAGELAIDIGIEAFKKGYVTDDAAKYPKVVFDNSASVWAVNNWSHDASAENKIAEKYVNTHTWASGDVSAGYVDVTHNLNTQRILVQVTNASEEVVFVKFVSTTAFAARIHIPNAAVDEVFDIVIIG